MHQSFQNSASGQTAHFFYFLYFPFIVASRLSSANTVSKYTFISSYDSSNSLVLLFTSLRKITFHLVSNNIKTAIAAVVVAARNENILILCIKRTSPTWA